MEKVNLEHTFRSATPAEIYAIVTDYPNYPKVFPDFTACRVLSENGNTKQVEFVAKIVMEVSYVLDIVHDPENFQTKWTFVRGKIVSDSVGSWKFSAQGSDTVADYTAGIAVNAPLPKMIINKVSNAIMKKSIPNLFKNIQDQLNRR